MGVRSVNVKKTKKFKENCPENTMSMTRPKQYPTEQSLPPLSIPPPTLPPPTLSPLLSFLWCILTETSRPSTLTGVASFAGGCTMCAQQHGMSNYSLLSSEKWVGWISSGCSLVSIPADLVFFFWKTLKHGAKGEYRLGDLVRHKCLRERAPSRIDCVLCWRFLADKPFFWSHWKFRFFTTQWYAVRCGQKINPNYWPLCCLVYHVILKSINSLFYTGQLPQLDPNCWSFRLLPHNITFTYYFCLCAQIPEFVLPHHLDALNAYKCVKSPNSSVPHSGPVIAGFICIPIIGE